MTTYICVMKCFDWYLKFYSKIYLFKLGIWCVTSSNFYIHIKQKRSLTLNISIFHIWIHSPQTFYPKSSKNKNIFINNPAQFLPIMSKMSVKYFSITNCKWYWRNNKHLIINEIHFFLHHNSDSFFIEK